MDVYVTGFHSTDIKAKLSTAEKFLQNLNRPTFLSSAQNDTRRKVMTGCLALIGDANPKVVTIGFDCMKAMMSNHGESFQPLVNMSFDILLNKFSDNKQQIRMTASELMIALFDLMDLSIAVDRLANQLSHKNFRIREQVLVTFSLLQDKYSTTLRSSPGIVAKIAALLSDQQSSNRQLAIETLVKLHQVFGHTLASLLEDCGLKTNQIRSIVDAANPHHLQIKTTELDTQVNQDKRSGIPLSSTTKRQYPVNGIENNIKNANIIEKEPAIVSTPVSQDDQSIAMATPSRLSLTSTSKPRYLSASRVRPSLGSTTTAAFSANNSPVAPNDVKASPSMDTIASFSSAASSSGFDPAYFMGLIKDGAHNPPHRLQNEKEMAKEFMKIKQNLANEDWAPRFAALQQLQKMATGNLSDYECGASIKQLTDAIIAQISDLRSQLSKEGSRTLATLAFTLGSRFRPLSEQWIPCLMKLVCNSTGVIGSAADRCIRVIVAMHPDNRLLAQLLDNCSSRTPGIRKLALEYVTLAGAVWKYDMIEKNFNAVKTAIQVGLVDADGSTRKAARICFLCLQARTQFQGLMDIFFRDLDPISQKHIQTEYNTPSNELNDILQLCRNPSSVTEFQHTERTPKPDIPISSSAGSGKLSAAAPSPVVKHQLSDYEDAPLIPVGVAESSVKPNRRMSLTTGAVRLVPKAAANTLATPIAVDNTHGAVVESEDNRDHSVRRLLSGGSRRLSVGVDNIASSRGSVVHSNDFSSTLPTPPTPSTVESYGAFSQPDTPVGLSSKGMDGIGFESTMAPSGGNRRASIGGNRLADGPKRIIRNVAGEATTTSTATTPMVVPSTEKKPVNPSVVPVLTSVVPPVPPEPVITSMDFDKMLEPAVSHSIHAAAPQPTVFIFSAETLRVMTEDSEWSVRLKAFESITQRIQRAIPANEALNVTLVESFIELSVAHMGDVHHRVAAEALQVIQLCLTSYADLSKGKLGNLVTALFHRLADRRPAVKEQANSILNQIRVVFDPIVIMASLSPKITEIPDRMKTALMQFLGAIAPYCTDYFSVAQNTWAFLGRMANILGCGGSKPSTGLTVAGRRLLELVYKTAPKIVCGQISTLTFQQQVLLKKLLEDSIPDIDTLVMIAGRTLEATIEAKSQAVVPVDIVVSESIISPFASPQVKYVQPQVTQHEKHFEETRVDDAQSASHSVERHHVAPLDSYDLRRAELLSPSKFERPTPVKLSSPKNFMAPEPKVSPIGKMIANLIEEHHPTSTPIVTATSSVTITEQVIDIRKVDVVTPAKLVAAQLSTPQPVAVPVAMSTTKNSSPGRKDTYWLLQCMQPEAPLEDKIEAAKELKILAKMADDSYWQANFAQIVSVLLESFSSSHMLQSKSTSPSSSPEGMEGVNESLHIVTKMLHLLVRYRGPHVKNFVDLLVSKLCKSAETAASPLVLLYEKILIDIGHYEPYKMVSILIPFTESGSLAVKLLSMHVICETLHFMTSAELLSLLSELVDAILPSINSDVVDLRKAVIFVLVEAYLTVSDALFPYLTSLQPSQRKLLTIYIEKKLSTRKTSV